MLVLAAVIPTKIAFDTVSGVMSNAGSSGPMPMQNYAPRTQMNRFPVQTKQPQNNQIIFPPQEELTYYLGSDPTALTCPSCFALVKTKVMYEKGSNPPSWACLYCGSKSIKDALHYCPKCHAFLGKFEP